MSTQSNPIDPEQTNDFQLVVEVGNIYSEEGLTRVKLDTTGRLLIEQQHDREQTESFSGELDPESTERIFKELPQFNWDQRFPPRPGLPDEAVVQWFFQEKPGSVSMLKVWIRDAEKPGPMATALTILRRAVERVTDGKLYL